MHTTALFLSLTAALGNHLPDGALQVVEATNAVELCQESVFPAALLETDVPAGHRLVRMSERPPRPSTEELLRKHPQFADAASGVFCFIEADFRVRGVPLHASGRSKMAFWWVDVASVGPEPADSRYRGPIPRAQVAWFYDIEGLNRELALATTPQATFARIRMEKGKDNSWSASLEAGDNRIEVDMTPTGPRKPLQYATPAYTTVPWIDPAYSDYFNVITYAGHHEQAVDARWVVTGNARWARLFGSDPVARYKSMIQDGVAARLALYRKEKTATARKGAGIRTSFEFRMSSP